MNIVLYTYDFEPITILDLPLWVIEIAEKRGQVLVAVVEPPSLVPARLHEVIMAPRDVVIRAERMRWRDGSAKTIMPTGDEELALKLKPSWLPGQRSSVQDYERTIRALSQAMISTLRDGL